MAGRTKRRVGEIAEKFHARYSSAIINPSVWNRIKEHAGPAGRVVILSTNFDFVIEPLRRQTADLEIHSTQATVQSGVYTGALSRHVGSGGDKLRLFESVVASAPGCETVGFGDSHTDYGFLGRCQQAWIVDRLKSSRLQSWRRMIDCFLGRFARSPVSNEIEFHPVSPSRR